MSDRTNAVGLDIPVQKKDRTISIKRILTILAFIAPILFLYGLYNVFAIGKTAYFSSLDRNGIMPEGRVGRNNWVHLVHDSDAWNTLKNNLILMVTFVCTQPPGALILALLINSRLKEVRTCKAFWLLPMLLSTSATGVLWNLIYDPNFDLLQVVPRGVGKGSLIEGWSGGPAYALPYALIVICWTFIPFYMILLEVGLTNMSEELMESAKLGGASSWQCFWNMTFSLLLPITRTVALLNIVGSLGYLDLIWIMIGGGPGNASELVATYFYKQGIQRWDTGYTSAIASFLFLSYGTSAIVYYGVISAFGEIGGERPRKSRRRETG